MVQMTAMHLLWNLTVLPSEHFVYFELTLNSYKMCYAYEYYFCCVYLYCFTRYLFWLFKFATLYCP